MATEPVRSTFDFLQWMDEDARLAYLATAKVRHFAAEQTIYLQGDPGFEMFRVKSGAVRLSVLSGDGRDVTYVRLGPGDCFGDVSMIDGEIRPQSAFAASDAAIEVLDRPAFQLLRKAHRSFDEAMLQLLSRQMRTASILFRDLSLSELSGRVARRILQEAQGLRAERSAQPLMRVALAQSEIASMVSASRQTVNRVLQSMQRDGIITTEYNAIIVNDLGRLREMAEDEIATIVAGATD